MVAAIVNRAFRSLVVTVVAAAALPAALPAQAVPPDTSAFLRALELETAGRYRDALPLYRAALTGRHAVNGFLGLERVMHELGWLDSLIGPLDTLIRANPAERVYRVSELRTLRMLGRTNQLRGAFERWVQAVPRSSEPYREYARMLIELNQRAAADSVLLEARRELGSTRGLEIEEAQVRAAMGDWEESAALWRIALASEPHMDAAAAYALQPAADDKRDGIRRAFLAEPMQVGARRALASLEGMWGSMAEGWIALRDLPADESSASAWSDFADRAMAEERWSVARDAWLAVLGVRHTPETAVRAATASLNAGDPAAVLRLIPLSQAGRDSARIARVYVPLHARALSLLGMPAEAEQLVGVFDRWIAPGPRNTLTRTIALGWVRAGDVEHARAALAAAGPDSDSSDTAGWLSLYDGDLKTARALLRSGSEATPELAFALGAIARVRTDSSADLGKAFLTLARADTGSAATLFEIAAERLPEAGSMLLLMSAQLFASRGDTVRAIDLWRRLVNEMADTPEAPQAALEWARTLRNVRDTSGAVARYEHLILVYPRSSLVPQARRELEALRSGSER